MGLGNSGGELAPSFLSFPLSIYLSSLPSPLCLSLCLPLSKQNHNNSLAFDAFSLSIVGPAELAENNEISIFPNDYLPQVMTTGNDYQARSVSSAAGAQPLSESNLDYFDNECS